LVAGSDKGLDLATGLHYLSLLTAQFDGIDIDLSPLPVSH